MLPVRPYEARILKLLKLRTFQNFSSETTQPADAAGKYPQRFPSANFDEPSARNVNMKRYFFL